MVKNKNDKVMGLNLSKKVVLWFYVIATFLDILFSALVIFVKGGGGLEINPIFVMSGSFGWLVFANLVALFVTYYFVRRASVRYVFFLLHSLVVVGFLRCLLAYNAFTWWLLPGEVVVESAGVVAGLSEGVRVLSYVLGLLQVFSPILLGWVSYWVFGLSYVVKEKVVGSKGGGVVE